ncbi:DUF1592 domain-containing protein [Stieleria varia]|nr:DUF1592 domain-containing protein [Stieleria varia]
MTCRILVLILLQAFSHAVFADDGKKPVCFAANAFHDSWIKVGERICMKCHREGGEAEESDFRLNDRMSILQNCKSFTAMALHLEQDGRSRLVAKATGGLDHGGGEVIKAGSTELRILEEFVRRVQENPSRLSSPPTVDDLAGFFDGVIMLTDQRLLRRITLSLAARLPTDDERKMIASQGLKGIESVLASVMKEDAFYQRLQEGFNDIFLTRGYNGNGDDALSYNHFEKTRHWYQKFSLDHLPEKERQKARYKLADQYREALRREPMELVRYIVQNERPFSEILTADYTMVSPYTARGYGIFDEVQNQFDDPDDPYEFIPARLHALVHRNGKVQPTADGFYPHAGLLSMFQYLRRYPTTETNRNRLRARMYYQHFLGVDIMNLAPRVSDAAAIDAKYETPTMQAAECVVCHRTIDPIAALFQDYYNEDGHYGPRKDGWFTDMFAAGSEGIDLAEEDRWRALPWLGEQTSKDPRFAIAMAEHVYYLLMGRTVLAAPDDIDDPHFAARRKAFLAQRELIDNAAKQFAASSYNLKVIFQVIATSKFYRADGLSNPDDVDRLAELDDIGVVRMLSPEQVERKIVAVFGKPWGRLDDSYAILYGGIDSKEVTERLADPSGAIGALQRILANDVACKNVAADFALPAEQRLLFPNIEIDVVPDDDDPESERKIREAIVHLHWHILGREDDADSAEVAQTYELFTGIVQEAATIKSVEPRESYFCKSGDEPSPRDPDPHYTLRAWRSVVTYLLRRREFLYE